MFEMVFNFGKFGHKPPSLNFYLAFLSLYLPFYLCFSFIGQTTTCPPLHIHSLLHVMCILIPWLLPLWILARGLPRFFWGCVHEFAVAMRYICNTMQVLYHILFIRLILSRASHMKYVLNKVKFGCCSDMEIVLKKFRSDLFPSISCNCNLQKTKWRVPQNLPKTPCGVSFCWQWFCQLLSMERRPPNLETFEDSLFCKVLWSNS